MRPRAPSLALVIAASLAAGCTVQPLDPDEDSSFSTPLETQAGCQPSPTEPGASGTTLTTPGTTGGPLEPVKHEDPGKPEPDPWHGRVAEPRVDVNRR